MKKTDYRLRFRGEALVRALVRVDVSEEEAREYADDPNAVPKTIRKKLEALPEESPLDKDGG